MNTHISMYKYTYICADTHTRTHAHRICYIPVTVGSPTKAATKVVTSSSQMEYKV